MKKKRLKSISLVNLDESTATMYPLVEPALEKVSSEQIYKKQSLKTLHIVKKINTPAWC